jgi:hypothetical protein
MNGPTLDAQADAIHGDKPGKLFGEILSLEDHAISHTQRPLAAHSWQVLAARGKTY